MLFLSDPLTVAPHRPAAKKPFEDQPITSAFFLHTRS
jgi:hypothetical protein